MSAAAAAAGVGESESATRRGEVDSELTPYRPTTQSLRVVLQSSISAARLLSTQTLV